ncbi:MAG: helix-turn-helix domain-containing protein [Pseudomonadota bacterium]|nr:helix-turn-helix domain-containing protein [Pseudomonadota bacterium]
MTAAPDPTTTLQFSLRCDHCTVRHKALCGALSRDELADLNRIARTRRFVAGESIMSAGEDSGFLANIVGGVVKLTKIMADGRQQIVGLQFAPDFLGRAFRKNAAYHAEAATDVELCLFPRTPFESLLRAKPDMEQRLLEETLDELDSAREWMLLLGRKTAQEKVASFLCMIARRSPQAGCHHESAPVEPHYMLPLSRTDIADYLGLTIETVSRQISKLKSQGIIRLHGIREFSVRDLAELTEIANIDADEQA